MPAFFGAVLTPQENIIVTIPPGACLQLNSFCVDSRGKQNVGKDSMCPITVRVIEDYQGDEEDTDPEETEEFVICAVGGSAGDLYKSVNHLFPAEDVEGAVIFRNHGSLPVHATGFYEGIEEESSEEGSDDDDDVEGEEISKETAKAMGVDVSGSDEEEDSEDESEEEEEEKPVEKVDAKTQKKKVEPKKAEESKAVVKPPAEKPKKAEEIKKAPVKAVAEKAVKAKEQSEQKKAVEKAQKESKKAPTESTTANKNKRAREEPEQAEAKSATGNGVPVPKKLRKQRNVSGVLYDDLVLGKGAEAKSGKKVKVLYVGKLENGKEFDANQSKARPFEFRVGVGSVIKGLDIGIGGMKEGGKRVLTIPSKLGYGARGAGKVIPPNSNLIFEIDLLSVK